MGEKNDVRLWLPAEWEDEVVPKMQASPDDYIQRVAGGFRLGLQPNDPEARNPFYQMPVEPGQVVEFSYMDHLGSIRVTVRLDGTFAVDRPVPERATHFWDGAIEVAESLDEAVYGYPDWPDLGEPLDPGEHDIEIGAWGTQFFRFVVDADGARFVPCEGAS